MTEDAEMNKGRNRSNVSEVHSSQEPNLSSLSKFQVSVHVLQLSESSKEKDEYNGKR